MQTASNLGLRTVTIREGSVHVSQPQELPLGCGEALASPQHFPGSLAQTAHQRQGRGRSVTYRGMNHPYSAFSAVTSASCYLKLPLLLLFILKQLFEMQNASHTPTPTLPHTQPPLTVLVVESEFLFFQLDRSVLPLLSCEPLWSQ